MPSERIPKKRRRSKFTFGATYASLVMLLAAASLYIHATETRHWLAEVNAQAQARARSAAGTSIEHASLPASDRCPDQTPVLIGFDSTGHVQCRQVSAKACVPGQYISSIDPLTLEIHCSDAGAELKCAADSYVTEFMWLGENRVSYSCFQRLDPFRAWKFQPSLTTTGGVH